MHEYESLTILFPEFWQQPIRCLSPNTITITWLASQSYTQYDLVRKPSTLDALIGYFTPSHVIYQRLLLQFLSAPEDGRKKCPKHVEHYCSY